MSEGFKAREAIPALRGAPEVTPLPSRTASAGTSGPASAVTRGRVGPRCSLLASTRSAAPILPTIFKRSQRRATERNRNYLPAVIRPAIVYLHVFSPRQPDRRFFAHPSRLCTSTPATR